MALTNWTAFALTAAGDHPGRWQLGEVELDLYKDWLYVKSPDSCVEFRSGQLTLPDGSQVYAERGYEGIYVAVRPVGEAPALGFGVYGPEGADRECYAHLVGEFQARVRALWPDFPRLTMDLD